MKILVTGGAGYIGSIMTRTLFDKGYEVVVVDSLERGNIKVVDKRAEFREGNLLDKEFVSNVFKSKFEAVIHFAAYISMEESVRNPSIYFENNVEGSRNVIEEMIKSGNNNFIFSSTAGVYGNPEITPMPEDHPKNPTNPYGESKLRVEEILKSRTNELSFVSLRYFNAAGATLNGELGENHEPETHIIPLAIKSAINNSDFTLYGNDYNTKDGTCVRDYIHVVDLVDSHVLAIDKLSKDRGGFFYNVGTGRGYTNREVLDSIEKVSGKKLKVKVEDRRPGDAEALIADSTRIKEDLGFVPKYSDLETIVKTAWIWHTKNSK